MMRLLKYRRAWAADARHPGRFQRDALIVSPPESSTAAFVTLFRSASASTLVTNLDTRVMSVVLCDMALPCTVNEGAPTCYICCPSTAYVDYAKAELAIVGVPQFVRGTTAPLLWAARLLIRIAGLDRQVQLNNWLVATNPAPPVARDDLRDLVDRTVARWPRHVVYWRSLDVHANRDLLDMLATAGWVLLPARMVYLFDCRGSAPKVGRDELRDRAILADSDYEVIDGSDFSADDFARAASLYAMLYLDKYTRLNPQYTATFIAGMVRSGLLEMKGLRSNQRRFAGIVGFFDGGDVMTAPIVGYDTSIPQSVGLYRMLMALAFARARARRMLFNASAGADSFKRNRGCVPVLEYSAVYNRHLPVPRRVALQILVMLLQRIAVPVFERYVA